jgi:ubiquinone biosynthesis protein
VTRIFIEDFGKPPLDLFDAIEVAPVASASIGQVHVAVLSGRTVAVKVQRPSARSQFMSDTRLMSFVTRTIRVLRLRPLYWLVEPISEFILWTGDELDYRSEARYMERLRQNAATNRFEHVPQIIWPYVSPRILVSEFLEGDTVLSYLRKREAAGAESGQRSTPRAFDPQTLASHIIDNFLGDVFQHGMFHADLHPANLMILPDNVVGYIDFGITGTISRYSRQNIVALTLAYTRGDLDAMCAAFFRVSAIDERSAVDRFRAGLELASRKWYSQGIGGRRLRKNFTLVMLDMLRLSRATGIFPERDVIKYIRSAIAIDGLITRLAPTFDVRRHLEQVCARYMADHLPSSTAVYETLTGCAASLLAVWRHGGPRAAAVLERLAEGELPVRIEFDSPSRRSAFSRDAVAAAAVFGAGLSILGLSQSTFAIAAAQVATVAGIVALLSRGGRRAPRPRAQM